MLLAAAGALCLRVTAIAQPLGIDQSLWASAVRGMDRGQLLYRDVWEQRPPGIYWAYLAAFRVFGWTAATVAWLDLLAVTLTTALVFAIGRTLGDRLTAAAAAAIYAAFTMPAWLYGNGGFLERAVSETFIVVCVCAMVWCAARWRQNDSHVTAFVLGLAAGATLVFKPNAGLYYPAVLVWVAVYTRERIRITARRALAALVIASAAALIVPVLTWLWLWRLDLLHDAKVAVVDFNRFYVGEGFDVPAYVVAFSKAVWLRIKTEPLWTAGAAGAVAAVWELGRRRRLSPLSGLTIIWGAAAVCVIVVNGARLFNSYFIQAFPPLALLGAWFLVSVGASKGRRIVAAAVGAIMALLLVQRDYAGRVFGQAAADLAVLTGETPRAAYLERFGGYGNRRGYSARANSEVAEYVRSHTAPDDRIFLFSINGAGVYFEADRLSAHRFLRVNFFAGTDFPHPEFQLESVVGDLERSRPVYLIFERLHRTADPRVAAAADTLPENPVLRPLLSGYRLETTIEDFALYRRLP